MSWNETSIASFLSRVTFANKNIVLVPNCSWPGNECDLLVVTTDLRIIDVEIKISRSDLKADAHKAKWWNTYVRHDCRDQHLCMPEPRLWPRRVWKHYYCMPKEIWKPELLEEIPPTSGVFLISLHRDKRSPFIQCERRATPNKNAYRLAPDEALDIARLANIRMWHLFESMERLKKDYADIRRVEVAA